MAKRLQIQLYHGWSDHSHENQGALATYVRDASAAPGALQVSIAEFRGPTPPKLTKEKLVALAVHMGAQPGFEQVSTACGGCQFGHWGSAVFRSERHPRAQYWHLSDGSDVIFVTHICEVEPDSLEIAEAQEIVESMHLAERPWWRFWK